jgi:fructokinase
MILCCGEALIDMIPMAQPDGKLAYVPHTGGAIFNTAIALGRLGTQTGLLSGVSNDAFGTLLTDTLTQNHVSTDLLIRSDHLTTLAVVHLKNGNATYSFYDEGSAGRSVNPADLPVIPKTVSTLYFGGISLVSAPAADAYAALLERAHANHIVMIDPNIRPAFIRDEAVYRTRLTRMIACCDIIKVSDEDLEWLMGSDATIEVHARNLCETGPKFVIVTKGAKGATAFDADGVLHMPAIAANVVDTVGAGDTFNAGFLAGLHEYGYTSKKALREMSVDDLKPALGLATKVAAFTVSQSGANPPWRSDV